MIYAFTFGFIVLDFVTGMVKAFATQSYKSAKMRQGLYHKAAELLCMALGVMVEYASAYLDLGISVPVAGAVCGYIVLMEVGSTIENLGEINPDILPEKLKNIFGGLK